jgi:hypothetical protein
MKNIASVILLSCLFLACAGARDQSRVEPLLFLPQQREIPLSLRSTDQPPAPFITATCNDGERGSARCSHVSVRLDTVLAASTSTLHERNRIIALLLGVSDYNCSAFTSRAFGRRAQLHTANAILGNVSAALASRSEKSSSFVSYLADANKIGNGVFGHPSQLGSAETVVEIAIGDARKKLRDQITEQARKDIESYTLLTALGDLAEYDALCSLQRGKELALRNAAEAAHQQEVLALEVFKRLQETAPAQTQPTSNATISSTPTTQ